MKNFEHWTDLISVAIGVVGALLKGIKKKFQTTTIVIGLIIAGVMTYATIGVLEMYFSELSPKITILISFCVGWVANEITEKLDDFVNDMYTIVMSWIKSWFKRK
jgi:hypothetical protein